MPVPLVTRDLLVCACSFSCVRNHWGLNCVAGASPGHVQSATVLQSWREIFSSERQAELVAFALSCRGVCVSVKRV